MGKALCIIDMVNDFITPSGKLYFARGQGAVESIVRIKAAFRAAGLPVLYGNDAHPANSLEFAAWGSHCVVGSPGAGIIPELSPEPGDIVLHKDSMSIFQNPFSGQILRGLGVTQLCLVGVATEYSVRHCALDAVLHDFHPVVISDAIADVEERPGDAGQALEAMRRAGVSFASAEALLADLR